MTPRQLTIESGKIVVNIQLTNKAHQRGGGIILKTWSENKL